MKSWTGLTKGEVRELGRAFVIAIQTAKNMEEMPGDAWLDAKLRERGCPEALLQTWCDRIRHTPLRDLADGGGN
jgi:hypothetical protein